MKRTHWIRFFYILAIISLLCQTYFILRYLMQPCYATLQVYVPCDENFAIIATCFLISGLLNLIAGGLCVSFKNKWKNVALWLTSLLAYLLSSILLLYLIMAA